jgi:hypothetical protein
METSSHIFWHAINKHEGKKIEKGPRILFGQCLFLDCPLRVFPVGPPNHTFIHCLFFSILKDGIIFEYEATNVQVSSWLVLSRVCTKIQLLSNDIGFGDAC